MSALGDEWPLDAQGYPHREAARVVLFDDEGRLLLARGHDADQPTRSWWFTIGGGIMAGEDPHAAAARELYEETGIHIDAADLVGPVAYRSAEFDFLAVTARQDEWFFVGHTHGVALSNAGWTQLELNVIDEQKWWNLDDLEVYITRSGAEIYPRDLIALARQWATGWDGTLTRIVEREADN